MIELTCFGLRCVISSDFRAGISPNHMKVPFSGLNFKYYMLNFLSMCLQYKFLSCYFTQASAYYYRGKDSVVLQYSVSQGVRSCIEPPIKRFMLLHFPLLLRRFEKRSLCLCSSIIQIASRTLFCNAASLFQHLELVNKSSNSQRGNFSFFRPHNAISQVFLILYCCIYSPYLDFFVKVKLNNSVYMQLIPS